MMEVKVLFFAALAERLGVRELALELPDGATVDAAIKALGERFPTLHHERENLALAVNLEYVPADQQLADGDELALIPPVSGG